MKQLLDKHKILTLVLAGVAGGVAEVEQPAFGQLIELEVKRWGELVKARGITLK